MISVDESEEKISNDYLYISEEFKTVYPWFNMCHRTSFIFAPLL